MGKPVIFLAAIAGMALLMAGDAFGQCQRGGGGGGSASMSQGAASMVSAGNPYLMNSYSGGGYGYSPMDQAYQQRMMMQQAYIQQVLAQRAYVKQQRNLKEAEGRQRLLAEAKARDARRLNPSSQYGTPLVASSGK